MYLLKRDDGGLPRNHIIETKDVKKRSDLRESEKLKTTAERRCFRSMSSEGIEVTFREQVQRDDIAALIKRVLAG
ncbi:hypothetical protein [Brachybacterium sacelli]|uniref:Restriction endonuclease n=1 Tax=Brachybacterium sacelli TaxID=173364 RepID=A0ABS4X488_9MICO|nr:hypothetical protein [Brachybacterium sacelli]MBP2383277.1 restriction endonuclease [Brachybacterium sacelli]